MKFDERYLDELKARLRLSEVIGRTVTLRRQGREYVGLSPFGKEKTPSFFVNDDKGFYYDFSSGKHGDLISFLQETEGLNFREAVERLAEMAGLSLPVETPQAQRAEKRRQSLVDLLGEAARWFQAQLQAQPGRAARAYLLARALPEEEWARFGLGYAPANGPYLKDHLLKSGAELKDITEAGLLATPQEGGAPYDRFRDRIMFPITDLRGRVVSFGGRALESSARAKYLNGPETTVFHKGSVLYGLNEARRLLQAPTTDGTDPPLVVVEGYMDVIACQRAGIAAAAAMGTALTEDQMAALWRLHPEPTLSFDSDAAGRRAAYRSLDRALPLLKPGRSLRFALSTDAKDPDEVLRTQGAEALRAQILQTRPFVEVLFQQAIEAAGDISTPERRIALKVELRRRAAAIVDSELSDAYRQDLLERFRALTSPARPETAQAQGPWRTPSRRGRYWGPGREAPLAGATVQGRAAAKKLSQAIRPVAASLAQGLLAHPELIDEQLEALEVQGFGDRGLETFAREIIRLRLTRPDLDSTDLGRHLAQAGLAEVLMDIERAARLAQAPFALADMPTRMARAEWSRTYAVLLELAALERAINDAKLEGDFEALQSLKAKRDSQKQRISSGALWEAEPSEH